MTTCRQKCRVEVTSDQCDLIKYQSRLEGLSPTPGPICISMIPDSKPGLDILSYLKVHKNEVMHNQ